MKTEEQQRDAEGKFGPQVTGSPNNGGEIPVKKEPPPPLKETKKADL